MGIIKKNFGPNIVDTVVCVYKGDAIIKQFFQKDNHIILQSENNNYSPIVAGKGELNVEGVVERGDSV